jgi:hypothetical protein
VAIESGKQVRRRNRLAGRVDHLLAVAVGLAVLVVHDVGYLLRHPFWLDEAWVALSTRARIGLLPTLTSSTPLGWTLLLRFVPLGGEQRLRLVPLAFTILAAVAAYYLGRELSLDRFVAGVLVGTAVLLVPAMLVRDDLKQYTAEAFASILLLLLVARIENRWTRSRLSAIAAVAGLGLFFTNSVVFVGVACMAGLAVECAISRDWHRLLEVTIASLGMLLLAAAVYEGIDRRHVSGSLKSYWAPYYVPRSSPSAATHFVYARLSQLAPYLGFGHVIVVGILGLSGVVVLVWLKRYALAVTVPLTILMVIVASADDRFPFGDLRTSTFWLVMVAALMAVGVVGAAHALARVSPSGALLVLVAALAGWIVLCEPAIRSHSIPTENNRSQILYVEHHLRAGDVIIVDSTARFGFAYYSRSLTPSFEPDHSLAVGFVPFYPHETWVVMMTGRTNSDVANALTAATERLDGRPGRIWIIRTPHTTQSKAWVGDLAGKDVTTIPVGLEPLLLYQVR